MEKWKMYMEIHQLLKQGFNKVQVAQKLDISRSTVYRYLERNPEAMSVFVNIVVAFFNFKVLPSSRLG